MKNSDYQSYENLLSCKTKPKSEEHMNSMMTINSKLGSKKQKMNKKIHSI